MTGSETGRPETWTWRVEGNDWPAIPFPDDYPSEDEVYQTLAEMDWPTS